MSDEKKKFEYEVDVNKMPKNLKMFMSLAIHLIELGTLEDQEKLGHVAMSAVSAQHAENIYRDSGPKIPEGVDEIIKSLCKEAAGLAMGGGFSTMMIALVAAKRLQALEKKNEKLTEMLVKADEKK